MELKYADKQIFFYCQDTNYKYFEDYVQSITTHLKDSKVILFNILNQKIVLKSILSSDPNSIHVIFQKETADLNTVTDTSILDRVFIINTEQMSRASIRSSVNSVKSGIRYIDYSPENIELYTNKNILYLPYQVNHKEIHNFKKTEGVAVVGTNSDYRLEVFNKISNMNIPILGVTGWNATRDNVLFRHKILLNLHYSPTYNIFEIIRCFRCTLNKIIVISEHSNNSDLLEFKDYIIFCDYSELADKTAEVYNNYDKYHSDMFQNFDPKALEKIMFDKLVKCFTTPTLAPTNTPTNTFKPTIILAPRSISLISRSLLASNKLLTKYSLLCNTKSDINEHLPTLRALASYSDSVCELGVRGVVSSYSLLYGLHMSKLTDTKSNKLLFMNDLQEVDTSDISQTAQDLNINLNFIKGSDLNIIIPQDFDMTFIDTWHVYGHLKRELSRYKHFTNKIIVLHDTTVDGELGETVRVGWNAEEQSLNTGIPVDEITKGLWPAVEEFLVGNKDWKLVRRYTNNNGLTVLAKQMYVADVTSLLLS